MLRSLALIFTFIALTVCAYGQSQNEQLRQMVAQLQTMPSDSALRERIIKFAAAMRPTPDISDAALNFEGRGRAAYALAKSADDYVAAANEYEKAVAADPWVVPYYKALAMIYEKAGKLEDAKRNCEFYLIGLSDPTQMSEVKRQIAGLKYGMERNAAKNAEDEKIARAAKARADETLIVPGERVGLVRLGMTESEVVAVLGSGYERRMQNLVWEEIGVTIRGNKGVVNISITDQHDSNGKHRYHTADGLSLDSSISDVKKALGPGTLFNFKDGSPGGNLCYSQGIDFFFTNSIRIIYITTPGGGEGFC